MMMLCRMCGYRLDDIRLEMTTLEIEWEREDGGKMLGVAPIVKRWWKIDLGGLGM